jgi:hypothetical protein
MDEELLPLIPMIRSFLINKDAPLHVSLTFGLNILLTSVFELQGNEDVHVLAVAAKVCYFSMIASIHMLRILILHSQSVCNLDFFFFFGHVQNSYFRFIEQVEIQTRKSFPHCPH